MYNYKGDYMNINTIELSKIVKSINLIDIREPFEFSYGHIENAINIPMRDLLFNHKDYLKKDKKYYIVCQNGARSYETCSNLTRLGYDVVNVVGGTGIYRIQFGLDK